ncbi:MAG: diguanylate cyclase [Solirubrobacterales bacterium]|jgi:diguanylate cyclase (GGDEF)-like protein/PAS domain S-box-containing protein|nr:diguanylate cyclase [Solirubrobacterales bacterium]
MFPAVRDWEDSRFVAIAAAVMFVAITTLRFLVDDPNEPYTVLYVLPIGLIANQFGVTAGLVSCGVALASFGGWTAIEQVQSTASDWFIRSVVFVGIGVGLGSLHRMRAREEQQNSRWFSMSNQMLSEASFDGYFTRVNDAWEECLGYTHEEMLSRPYFDLVHPDDQQPTLDVAGALAKKDFSVVSFRNRYRAKDGSWHWLSWSARSDSERIYAAARDITEFQASEAERERLLAKIDRLAHTDELTGLPNRRAWDEEITRELSRSKRLGFDVSVAMVDLDRFKDFNDLRGHPAGDRLLRDAAERWRQALRVTDFLARTGGEEFAALLPGCRLGQASAVIGRLRAATPDDQTCSVGLAHWDGEESAASVLSRADVALYEAKRGGRDRTELAAA